MGSMTLVQMVSSGQTAEAEGKARRILADDAEDLWTALNRAGNDLIDSATTVNYIYRTACSLDSRIKGDEMSIDGNNQVTINPDAPSDSSSIDNQVNYQIELDDLMVQAAETVTFISLFMTRLPMLTILRPDQSRR